MPHRILDLERRFRRLTQEELEHPENISGLEFASDWDSISAADLLCSPRVVLLAEAGTGKTTEMKRMASQLQAAGKFAFFLEIETLARGALPEALDLEDVAKLDAWAASKDTNAWFFLDAVDELKLTQGRFDAALRSFAKGIGGRFTRASVVISCRPSDWRPQSDLHAVQALLPVGDRQDAFVNEVDPFFELLEHQAAHSRDATKTAAAPPSFTTVILVPLSEGQARDLAFTLTDQADALIAEIGRQHAWDFARRPLDVIELARLWAQTGRLGSREEQHAVNIGAKLRERPGRPDNSVLAPTKALEGAQRLALALALTRTRHLKAPDMSVATDRLEGVLDPLEVLADWTEAEVLALLRRGLFDPATYGRVRFHHRSVQEYLAGQRLTAMRAGGMSMKALFALLFAEMHGTRVLIPSMRPITAWVALWLEEVRREVIAREPEVLLTSGDPESIPLPARVAILEAFVAAYSKGGWRGINIAIDEVRRLASRDLEPHIARMWPAAKSNEDTRELLLELLWKSGGSSCLAIAYAAARERAYSGYHRLLAVKVLQTNGQTRQLRAMAKNLLAKGAGGWPSRTVATVACELYPGSLSTDELLALIERTPEAQGSTEGFRWRLRELCEKIPLDPDASSLRRGLARIIAKGAEDKEDVYEPRSTYAYLSGALRRLCLRQLQHLAPEDAATFWNDCVAAHRYRYNLESSSRGEYAAAVRGKDARIRRPLFWAEIEFVRQFARNDDPWQVMFAANHGSVLGDLETDDHSWLLAELRKRRKADRAIALVALVWIWRRADRDAVRLDEIRAGCGAQPQLLQLLQELTTPRIPSATEVAYETQRASRAASSQLGEELRLLAWDAWRQEVLADPGRAFSPPFQASNTQNMMKWLSSRHDALANAWDRARVIAAFNAEVADHMEPALYTLWRRTTLLLPSERPKSERRSFSYAWFHALAGLHVESRRRGWAETLSADETRIATRYATLGVSGFPEWLAHLAAAQPQIVRDVLGTELRAQVAQAAGDESPQLIQTVSHAKLDIKVLLYPVCRQLLGEWNPFQVGLVPAPYVLEQLLRCVVDVAHDEERLELAALCREREAAAATTAEKVIWLKAFFQLDAEAATQALERSMHQGGNDDSISLLAAVFGDAGRLGSVGGLEQRVSAHGLAKLVRAAYRAAPPVTDNVHEGAYTPNERDQAGYARAHLLQMLVNTAGRTARDELIALAKDPLFKDVRDRIRHLARERAARDAEFDAYDTGAIRALEARLEAPPRTRDALYGMMMDRLDDVQHDIAEHAFSDRRSLREVMEEIDMQRTLAMRLESKSKQNYAVMRETEVADSKRTDIVLAAAASLQSAVIEIKIADTRWGIPDLEKALTRQLVGFYQRHDNCRAGCLLLVNNGKREVWASRMLRLDWQGLLEHLRGIAGRVEAGKPELRVGVYGLDLRDPPLPH